LPPLCSIRRLPRRIHVEERVRGQATGRICPRRVAPPPRAGEGATAGCRREGGEGDGEEEGLTRAHLAATFLPSPGIAVVPLPRALCTCIQGASHRSRTLERGRRRGGEGERAAGRSTAMGGVGGPRADLVPRQLSESSMAVIAFNPRRLHPLHWLHRGGGGPDVGG
jgi:hypothetical protein